MTKLQKATEIGTPAKNPPQTREVGEATRMELSVGEINTETGSVSGALERSNFESTAATVSGVDC